MNSHLRVAIARELGADVVSAVRVAGGDINEAWYVQLANARHIFVKTNPHAPPEMFPAEARGLAWLTEPGALRLPRIIAVTPEFLALEHLTPAPRVSDFDGRLGRGLAALHASGPARFGLDHDNFIGRLPQRNDMRDDWATFYRELRLEPQVEMAAARGLADTAMRRAFDRLYAKLPELVGPAEPPARLHGDLWGGNLHVDERGEPCLIDPAAYAGHREVDLAMMRLFGGYSERVFDAYAEGSVLAPGHAERVPLYQLYFLLAHVNLFGGSYVDSVRSALVRLV